MQTSVTWDDVTSLYRKKPARFKAIQYNKDELLPPDTSFMLSPDGKDKVLVASLGNDRTVLMEDGSWLVKDLLTNLTCVLPDTVFNMLFEHC